MIRRFRFVALAAVVVAGFTITVMASTAPGDAREPQSILFIGNSYCDFYVIPSQVEAMLKHAGHAATCKRETHGGYTWQKHWDGAAPDRIKAEPWNIIVLQNHSRSTLDRREAFDDYGRRFVYAVRQAGAQPLLYLTWARQHMPEDQATITEAYCTLALLTGAKVAPVGEAFKAFKAQYPDIPLHREDQSHPSETGAYLSACVFFATITGQNPVGMPYSIDGYNWLTKGDKLVDLDGDLARKVQQVAWDTVSTFDVRAHAAASLDHAAPPAPVAAAPPAPVSLPGGSAIQINFGGKTTVTGWNDVGGVQSEPMALVTSDGAPSGATVTVHDAFQVYANKGVYKGDLTGEAALFKPAADATLFTHRGEGNPTGGITLNLDASKTYTLKVWASRSGNGRRWARYIVKGAEEQSQFLAAGGLTGGDGNTDTVLTFADVATDAQGRITLDVVFPEETDSQKNLGDFTYLTGLIVLPAAGQ